jgi:hypothetical protein
MLISLEQAVAKISAKTPIGSLLRTAEWARLPVALRERAFFSAGVTSVKLLQSMGDSLKQEINLLRSTTDDGKPYFLDRSKFIDAHREMGRSLGLAPAADDPKAGGLQDITSIPRLGLIYDMQKAQAEEYARFKLDQTEGALMLYPAQRLVRIEGRMVPRDWPQRWDEAGTLVGWDGALQSPMVALKTSPIWEALSRFDTPWPPFDFNSGMGLEDVDREESVALGLIQPDEELKPIDQAFNDKLEASMENVDQALRTQLLDAFGDQVELDGDTVKWRAA